MDDIVARLKALDLGGQIMGGALVLALISMFFHWWSWSVTAGPYSVSGGANGFHGWGWFYFILWLALAAYFVAVVLAKANLNLNLPVADKIIFAGGGALMIVAALLFYLGEPSGTGYGVSFGWFLALLAAIGVTVGGWLTTVETNPAGWNPMKAGGSAGGSTGASFTGSSSSSPSPTPPPTPAPAPPTPVESAPDPDSGDESTTS